VLGLVFATAVTLLVAVFPGVVMSPFNADRQVLAQGAVFVRVIALGYLPTMLTLMDSGVMAPAALRPLAAEPDHRHPRARQGHLTPGGPSD
jgi:hypothetical protein